MLGVSMNEEYELVIEKFDHEARGIGYIDGIITFVDDTVPGDIVIVKINKRKKKYCIASVVKFLKYSQDRINPICPYFSKCGGCDIQNISYIDQLKFKENKIREILDKFAGVSSDKLKPIIYLENNIYNYRNKITLQVKQNLGLFSKNSYDLVLIDNCYIVSNKINNIINIIKQNINLVSINQIVIRNSFYNDKIMVIFDGNSFNLDNLKSIKSFVDSIYIRNDSKYELIYGDEFIEDKIGDYIYKISPDSFFQVNTYMCRELYDKIVECGNFSKTDNVLDLYCGTGTIGIYISKYVNKVIGYEINKYAVKDAKINAINNLVDNAEFYCGSSELSFENITDKINIIIVDPPRSGLNDKTINGIISVKPCKVIYVSCDPVTLARDLKILRDWYDVIEVTPVDMFPNTKHIECVCLLKLK